MPNESRVINTTVIVIVNSNGTITNYKETLLLNITAPNVTIPTIVLNPRAPSNSQLFSACNNFGYGPGYVALPYMVDLSGHSQTCLNVSLAQTSAIYITDEGYLYPNGYVVNSTLALHNGDTAVVLCDTAGLLANPKLCIGHLGQYAYIVWLACADGGYIWCDNVTSSDAGSAPVPTGSITLFYYQQSNLTYVRFMRS